MAAELLTLVVACAELCGEQLAIVVVLKEEDDIKK